MNKIWTRSLTLLGLAIAVWLIWYFFKPKVYDIPVPQVMMQTELFQEIPVTNPGRFLDYNEKDSGNIPWDSITTSGGLDYSEQNGRHFFVSKPMARPLEMIKYWYQGFCYTQVITKRSSFPDDTCCLESSQWLMPLGFWDQKTAEVKPGVFKENYEGNEIVLKLEKKKPTRIVALWENFRIVGETNGELVKIKIPKCAYDVRNSTIRVWVSDETVASPVCEIPLSWGVVASKYQQVASSDKIEKFRLMEHIARTAIIVDTLWYTRLKKDLSICYNDPHLKLALAYGDVRFLPSDPNVWIFSYFGKKVICVFNVSGKRQDYKLPVKGDLKHTSSGKPFLRKGGHIEFSLDAGKHELIY